MTYYTSYLGSRNEMWNLVHFHLVNIPLCIILCGLIIKKSVWKICFEPKRSSKTKRVAGRMIEDGLLILVIDRMPAPQVMMNLISNYANMSVQYTAIFHGCKNDKFQMKIFDIFLIFALKHRLWVLVRNASLRRF